MVYLHNFYLNPMFDPSGPRPGADAHNCTVGYVSEYKPPSLYPGVNLTTINDGDGFAQVPHPGLPRETPLVLAANTHADEGGADPCTAAGWNAGATTGAARGVRSAARTAA